jgi:hypothetical protein
MLAIGNKVKIFDIVAHFLNVFDLNSMFPISLLILLNLAKSSFTLLED